MKLKKKNILCTTVEEKSFLFVLAEDSLLQKDYKNQKKIDNSLQQVS